MLQYNGHHWELKDLRSTNGTFVSKRRIEREVLSEGTEFNLGGVVFQLIDTSPPRVSARNLASNEMRYALAGLLMLPDDEHPAATIFEGARGRWVLESQNEQREVSNNDVVVVGGESWKLEIPDPKIATLDTAQFGLMLETIALRFTVSLDEEHIELTLLHDGGEIPLGTRRFHYLLLTLARAWLSEPDAPPSERGWVDREQLCRMLNIDANKLNVDIFRARGQLSSENVHGAASLIMRRADTGQLRLGVPRIEILQLRSADESFAHAEAVELPADRATEPDHPAPDDTIDASVSDVDEEPPSDRSGDPK